MKHFTLRPWQEGDAPSLARYASDPEIARNLSDTFPHPYRLSDAEDFFRLCAQEEGKNRICRGIIVDGQAAGCIDAIVKTGEHRKNAVLGYWLAKPYWGRGIMTAAVPLLCREAFAALDIARIYAEVFARNTGSRRVLEKNGFRLEGCLRKALYRDGELLDDCLYALLREELS